jgi:hypothetical protein
MSKNDYYNPVTGLDKSKKGLSCCKDGVDRTCPVPKPGMSNFAYWNPATDPDKFRGLRNFKWPKHVRVGGQICLVLLTRTRLGDRICPVFLGSWFKRYFWRYALHQLTQCIPLDSTELLGHKLKWKLPNPQRSSWLFPFSSLYAI